MMFGGRSAVGALARVGGSGRSSVRASFAGALVAVAAAFMGCLLAPGAAFASAQDAAQAPAAAPAAAPTAAPAKQSGANASSAASDQPFSARVDLTPLATIAVQSDGRLKSLSSFSSETMAFVSGPRQIAGQSPLFTYLDMMFRPDAYRDADVIFVKGAGPRARIADAVLAGNLLPEMGARMEAFRKTGLISQTLLSKPEVLSVLREMQSDLLRTAKIVDAIESALNVKDPRFLLSRLRMVPRGDGDPKQPWHGIAEVMFADGKEPVPGAMLLLAEKSEPPTDIPEASRTAVADAWKALVNSWLKADAAGVNAASAALAAELPKIDPAGYPQRDRLAWEHWYFSNGHMTKTWLVYMAASILLLLGFVYRWPRARTAGFVVFAAAVALHTLAVMLRWYIAGRWPNSNMFEAVTTAAWFGAVGAIAIEWFVRRTAMYSMFALGAAVSAMVALMAAYFLPVQLNPSINNMMPVLHDVWLYIHTNVIIFSYVLIFMAAVSGGLYVGHRMLGGAASFARVGGAGSLIVAGPDGEARMEGNRAGLGEVLDGVTMVLMEISFVLLWAGIVMGAIWADHSWGRPWGWDPKEVFALNTFIVFAVLVHVRLKVKDKGMWTAILAVIGAAVMLFNWIVINFVITGLHSYA
jgi:cytochrome c-type biogenesis protein CcsB